MASPSIRPFSVLLLCLFHGFSLATNDLNDGGLHVGGVQAAWPFPGGGGKGGRFVGGGVQAAWPFPGDGGKGGRFVGGGVQAAWPFPGDGGKGGRYVGGGVKAAWPFPGDGGKGGRFVGGGVQAAWPFPGDGGKGGRFVGGGVQAAWPFPGDGGKGGRFVGGGVQAAWPFPGDGGKGGRFVGGGGHVEHPRPGLDHPILSLSLNAGEKISVIRSVTNVGCASSTYRVEVSAPPGVSVAVSPAQLTFSSVKETKQYTVTFTRLKDSGLGIQEGALRWIAGAGKTTVRSPIVVNLL